VRAILKLVFQAALLVGGMAVHLHNAVFEGVCEVEGLAAGVDHWEVGGGDATESEAPKPKESRGH
jgi:hypothetical protein